MRLTAISTGYAIPYIDFDATTHSVFRTAVNLRLAGDDLLLSLVIASEADLPQGIRLNSPDDFSFEQLCPGRKVFCRNNILIFEDSALEVEFYQGKRWRCDLPALNTDLTNPLIMQAWKCIWQALNERQVAQGAEIVARDLLNPSEISQSVISRRVGEAIRILIEAAHSYRLDDLSSLTMLIGLGTGLTPCGDDFLVGYLAGLWCTVQDSVERRQFVSRLGLAVRSLSARTNDISRTYLYYATYGQVSSRLDTLARAISRPESPERLLPVAEVAMQSGHTSGMDALTGLLLGLATWNGETVLAI